ncbi:MAG: GDYXXLXY domain-containing protein [Candidatus Accumulibacter sp.]|jgi:uncharacterized membrane-anchored protein|nr:GDYXXLXY domain-containing protein [Accumulibacter sp.]
MNSPKFFRTLAFKYAVIAALPLAAMFHTQIVNFTILAFGEPVLLETAPVDPRDILRGDYVTLGYEIGNIDGDMLEKAFGETWKDRGAHDRATHDVFVILERGADGVGRVGSVSASRPPEGLYIEGRLDWRGNVDYGIGVYYVPEGTGHAMENRIRGRDGARARADVRVMRGHAVIKALIFPEVPEK